MDGHRAPDTNGNTFGILKGEDLSDIFEQRARIALRLPPSYQDAQERPKTTIFELLSGNYTLYDENAPYAGQYYLNQAFSLAGSRFRVFDSNTWDLIVPYGQGVERPAELTARDHPDPAFLASWERSARAYTVSVCEWQLKALGNQPDAGSGV